jgi:predicted RNase H-like HicB family nuclease
MSNIEYIPVEKNIAQQSFLFNVHLAPKSNGLWFAWIAVLPGCAAWGVTRDEALMMLTQTARAYVRHLITSGEPLPDTVQSVNAPLVVVTV